MVNFLLFQSLRSRLLKSQRWFGAPPIELWSSHSSQEPSMRTWTRIRAFLGLQPFFWCNTQSVCGVVWAAPVVSGTFGILPRQLDKVAAKRSDFVGCSNFTAFWETDFKFINLSRKQQRPRCFRFWNWCMRIWCHHLFWNILCFLT